MPRLLWITISAITLAALIAAAVTWRLTDGTRVSKGVRYMGRISEPAIRESSGIAASHRYPGVFWTHNDSDNPEVLYAITQNGTLLGQWHVLGRRFADWEDITFDNDGHLLLADTGDNRLWRKRVAVHRISEPDPATQGGNVEIEQTWFLNYPNGNRNAEGIFVLGPHAYLVTKRRPGRAELYRFPLSSSTNTITVEFVGEIEINSRVTSAALSPTGDRLALMTSLGAFGYRIDGDISRLNRLAPEHFTKFGHRRIEGCTFTPEGLLTTSERRHMYLFTNQFFRAQGPRRRHTRS